MTRKLRLSPNLLWTIGPSLLFFKIIGLATFSVRNPFGKTKCSEAAPTFVYSKLGILYNSVLSGLTFCSYYVTIPYRYHLEYPNKTVITTTIEILQTLLGGLTICTILLSYCANQSALVRIGNRLIDVEWDLNRLHRPAIQRKRIFRTLVATYLLTGCLFVAVAITDVWAFQTGPLSWLTDIVPAFCVGWLLVQYFSTVSLVETAFVDVNRGIRNLSRSSSVESRPQSLYRTRRVFVSASSLQHLLQLRDVHDRLCEIASEVSQFYSLPILLGISFLFFTLLYNTYYLVTPVVVNNEILDYALSANTILWIAYLVCPVVLLTNGITKILDEMEKTGNLVHALVKTTIDQETRRELEQFSLQLLHRKIKFTASGYFVLDNTLFHSIVYAITSYLVILIQFEMATSLSTVCQCTWTSE